MKLTFWSLSHHYWFCLLLVFKYCVWVQRWSETFCLQLNKKMKEGRYLSETKYICTFNLYLQLCIITLPHNLFQPP